MNKGGPDGRGRGRAGAAHDTRYSSGQDDDIVRGQILVFVCSFFGPNDIWKLQS